MIGDTTTWSIRPATSADAPVLASIKLDALRFDLERLGRWNPPYNRERFLSEYDADQTVVVVSENHRLLGCFALQPTPETTWLRHFYLAEEARGRGIGTSLLSEIVAATRGSSLSLTVLTGSRAENLYRRHGFVTTERGDVDTTMRRPADTPSD
ncbi:GNAT family N-acetyltransferase [Frigoribacterium sp. 2-23]|uniref:GNAT family N-acetyltransferase n=1 Tax=Frigoribacterium sp. 2-23 TaxID=3415006 RepID=UPI003C6FFF5C